MENVTHKIMEESLSLTPKSHTHKYLEKENYLICSICKKKILKLNKSDNEHLLKGIKGNGSEYTVRRDRHRYFFPSEWENFIKLIDNKQHRFFFLTCLHTGGRIMEVLNLRYKDIDLERGTIEFPVVKQRKAKKNFYATGKTRGFFVSSNYLSEFRSFVRGKTINQEEYIFLENSKLPKDYNSLSNELRKSFWIGKSVAYSNLFKRYLKKSGLEDWKNFSPHNIRKTYGMWMRTFNMEMAELCYRMGHDMDTYLAHYGSSLIFTEEERRRILKIMGDVK